VFRCLPGKVRRFLWCGVPYDKYKNEESSVDEISLNSMNKKPVDEDSNKSTHSSEVKLESKKGMDNQSYIEDNGNTEAKSSSTDKHEKITRL